MRSKKSSRPVTQRQLRVGEMIKQALGIIFVRGGKIVYTRSPRNL